MVTITIPGKEECLPEMRLEGEQAKYATKSLHHWLKENREDREKGKTVCFLIKEGKDPVGFFALSFESKRLLQALPTAPHGSALLRNFFILPSHQRKGHASKVLQRLPKIVLERFPLMTRLFLLVNFENQAAQRAYLKNGFCDTGIVDNNGAFGPAHLYVR